MDKKIPIKMLLDSLIENNDILMCKVIGEKSGSTLIKIRVDEPKHGDQTCDAGEATPITNRCVNSKKQNQVKSDSTKSKKHQGQSTGLIIKTRSCTAKEEARSSSPVRDYLSNSEQVASPESVMNSPDITLECLSFPAQSPVEPNHDGSAQSPMESKHHGGEEYSCLSDSHSGENILCLTDCKSDSEPVASDPQLEASSELSVKETPVKSSGSDSSNEMPVKTSDSESSNPPANDMSDFERCLLAALEKGLQRTYAELVPRPGGNNDPVDDT